MGPRILRKPRWVLLAATVCLAVLGACERKAPMPPGGNTAPPSAPAPAPEPGTQASSSTAPDTSQSRAQWTPLSTDGLRYIALREGYFHSNGSIDRADPRVAVIQYPQTEGQRTFTAAHEESGEVVTLTPALVQQLDLETPKAVWLFGEDGPCRATLRDAYAVVQYEIEPILERGFFLEACTDDYAPVGWVGEQPPDLRWHHASFEFDEIVENPDAMEHPAREQLVELGLLDNIDPDTKKKAVTHVRILMAGPVTEFGVMQHWPHPEDCEEMESGAVRTALWDGTGVPQWLDAGDRFSSPELMGTLTLDGSVAAIVYDERFQMYVQTSTDYLEFLTGDYHDEDVAFWGWSVLEGYCGP